MRPSRRRLNYDSRHQTRHGSTCIGMTFVLLDVLGPETERRV
jgi:hypothetical protein